MFKIYQILGALQNSPKESDKEGKSAENQSYAEVNGSARFLK